jgi:restriction endonuclease S subunit
MKSGWQTSTLGDVLAVIRNGANCKQDKSGNGDRISRIESISDTTFDLEKVGYAKLSERDKEKNRLLSGDILFSHINSPVHVGKTAVFDCDEPVYHGVNLLLMRPKEVVTSAYLNHALRFLFQNGYWRGVCKQSVNQASVNQQDISRVEIRYPKSLPEQRRIVGILDEAFAGLATAKANAEKNLHNARALFESHLQSVFSQRGNGWQQKTLEEVATTFGRGKSKHRPRNEPRLYGGKYPFIQTGDIRNADHFVTEYSQTYSEAGLAQSKLWPKGTICITIAANIAETAILGFDACFPDSVIGVVANPKEAEVGFIEYLLQSFKARLQALGKGSAQANINMGTFENERFPFPPVAEQRQIVAKLDALSSETTRLAAIYQQKLAALEALKKSLLHQAFSGEL